MADPDLTDRALMCLVENHLAEMSEGAAHDWLEAADLRASLRRCKRRFPDATPLAARVKQCLRPVPCTQPDTQPLPVAPTPSVEDDVDFDFDFEFVCPSSQPTEPLAFHQLLCSVIGSAHPDLRFEFFRMGAALEVLSVDEGASAALVPAEFRCLGSNVEVCKDEEECMGFTWVRKFDFLHEQAYFPASCGRFAFLDWFQPATTEPDIQVRLEPHGGYLLLARHARPVRKFANDRYTAQLVGRLNELMWEALDTNCSPPVPNVRFHTTRKAPVYMFRTEDYSGFTDRVNALMVRCK